MTQKAQIKKAFQLAKSIFADLNANPANMCGTCRWRHMICAGKKCPKKR